MNKINKKKILKALLLFSILMLILTPLFFDFKEQAKAKEHHRIRRLTHIRFVDQIEVQYDLFEVWKPFFYITFFVLLGLVSYILLIGKNAYKVQSGIESKVFHATNHALSYFKEIRFSKKQKFVFLMFFFVCYAINVVIFFAMRFNIFKTTWYLIPIGVGSMALLFFLFCDVNLSKCKNTR